jgi:hypothetical protein
MSQGMSLLDFMNSTSPLLQPNSTILGNVDHNGDLTLNGTTLGNKSVDSVTGATGSAGANDSIMNISKIDANDDPTKIIVRQAAEVPIHGVASGHTTASGPVSNETILLTLTTSVASLSQELKDMRLIMTKNHLAQESKMEILETTIAKKYEDLKTEYNGKFTTMTVKIETTNALAAANAKEIYDLKNILKAQQDELIDLKNKLKAGDLVARKDSKNAIFMANSTEAHNRRWSLRILGLPAPEGRETTAEAKMISLAFFTDNLKVPGLSTMDIDCAHRVGKVSASKQTMLVRLYERDYVDLLLKKKSNLKGSTFVLYEDATFLDRKLINLLNDHPLVENAWMTHGTIWAKKVDGGDKVKVTIKDDINSVLT